MDGRSLVLLGLFVKAPHPPRRVRDTDPARSVSVNPCRNRVVAPEKRAPFLSGHLCFGSCGLGGVAPGLAGFKNRLAR